MKQVTVDIGCGSRKVEGAIGIDEIFKPGVNIVCDLEQAIPLQTNSVNILHARHILEHIQNFIQLMEEIYRVSKPGGLVYITVPHFMSRGAFRDPTHVRFITEDTFMYFQEHMPYQFKTHFEIQTISYKYRTFFRYFPRFLRYVSRKYLWNVVEEIYITLKVLDSSYKSSKPD